jgi:hypothetical protein
VECESIGNVEHSIRTAGGDHPAVRIDWSGALAEAESALQCALAAPWWLTCGHRRTLVDDRQADGNQTVVGKPGRICIETFGKMYPFHYYKSPQRSVPAACTTVIQNFSPMKIDPIAEVIDVDPLTGSPWDPLRTRRQGPLPD